MPFFPLGQTFWAIIVLVIAVLMSVAVVAVIWDFARRRERQPDATRFEDLKERNAALSVRRHELEAELRELDQKIQNRDRVAAEVAALSERLESLRAELSALTGAEQQIEAMKQRAAEVAADYSEQSVKLEQAKSALSQMESELTEARNRCEELHKEADALEAQNAILRKTLPDDIAQLHAKISEMAEKKLALEQDIRELDGAREDLYKARDEAAALSARNEMLRTLNQGHRDELSHELDELQQQADRLSREISDLNTEITQLQVARASLIDAREEVAMLTSKLGSLNQAIDDARDTRDRILSDGQLEARRRQIFELNEEIAALRSKRATVEQMVTIDEMQARKASLEEKIAQLRSEAEGKIGVGLDPDVVSAELKQLPDCLKLHISAPHPTEFEETALFNVSTYLENLGLHYTRRTLYAFHTALKVNETSQMAILAGVSGTGKSLLPRRYAEAMGLRFLQIAVEPRWDSPQDLLGFYNYIEKRYRATDLARALVQMDPYNTSNLSNRQNDDQMMLVLLDEMNLARVEYYFSEFLSRLEVRPSLSDAGSEARRTGACLTIDIPGRSNGEGSIRLFPSHNVLFVGTMNDDESTQSLSDKVLDRSNLMQFAAPDDFKRPNQLSTAPIVQQYRSFKAWQNWVRSADDLDRADREKASSIISDLAQIMQKCGRPFGHRLNDAMLAYVANYPNENGISIDVPMVDQIELRILPKLRGLAIQDHETALDELTELVQGKLGDHALAARLKIHIERQKDGSGQLNWRGFNRA